MIVELENLTEEDILTFLSDSIQFKVKFIYISEVLQEPDTCNRMPQIADRKRHFHLKAKNDQNYHLTVGNIELNLWKNSKYAYKNLKNLVCEPIFFGAFGAFHFFIQEYFNGIPIDLALEKDLISQDQVGLILETISKNFESMCEQSSVEELKDEREELLHNLNKLFNFSDIDKKMISLMLSSVYSKQSHEIIKRWSPGDLAARNILVATDGTFKLIDFEWARKTHFFQEDWLRLFFYSNSPFKENLFLNKKISEIGDFYHMYFWLRQTTLDTIKHSEPELNKYTKLNLRNVLLSFLKLTNDKNLKSLILDSCGDYTDSLERYQFIHSFLHESHTSSLQKLDSKVTRMQASLSWRITSPFRLIRRKYFDRHKLDRRGQYCVSKKHYRNWIRKFDKLGFLKKRAYRHKIKSFDYQPLVSIILPVFDPEKCFLDQTLSSVFNQLYQNWELCICNDGSKNPQIQSTIDEIVLKDDRIKYVTLNSNMHISHSSNRAVDLAKGDYLTFLDHDDLLRPHSLYKFIERLNKNRKLKFVYSDEDKIDELNQRYDHYFKPDWNPDLLLSQNYICHMVFCRTQDFREVGGFREGFEGSQDWDLFLRITEKLKTEEIGHVSHVLYHWRSTKNSTATSLSTKKYVIPRSLRSVNDALKRRKVKAIATVADRTNGYLRVHFHIPRKAPRVSILIPTKDHFELITRCVESILLKTNYNNYELILLDNDTTCKRTLQYFSKIESINNISIRKISCPFNYSYINNLGVESASGDILAFVNNDIEAISGDWLGEMVSHAVRPEIGCVGSKLLYPDNHIQHAGVILGIGGIAGHGQKHFPSWNDGYKHRLKIVQNYEAVTAACMLVEKKIFRKVGGFDEENLKIAYNDVDLCIKVREEGYLNLWTPYALLKHHESASRGFDQDPAGKARFAKEKEYMKKRWAHKLISDPSYNPNLSLKHEDFSLNYRLHKKK